jgi:hypothetical protein
VLLAHVYTLHNHTLLIGQHFDHFASLTFVLEATADHFNNITFAYLNFHGLRS